jgi:O-antigen/teichoic acid export membrane protein
MYGPKFSGAVPIMFASLIMQAITVIFFGGGMQITSLVAIGKERVVFKNRLTWGAINLVANYFLILKFGAIGAMIGTQCSNCGACATESVLTARWIGQSFQPKRAAFIVSVVAISLTGSYLLSTILPAALPSFVLLLGAGIMMAILTTGGYLLLRVPEAMKAISRLRGLFGPADTQAVAANL